MFAINRRLKRALLVVGVLAVVFGMYGAFQVREADAHHGSIQQWSVTWTESRIVESKAPRQSLEELSLFMR